MIDYGVFDLKKAENLHRLFSAGTDYHAALLAVHALAHHLMPEQRVLNLCENRYYFVLGLLAAQQAGALSVLPPNRSEQSLSILGVQHQGLLCLVDRYFPNLPFNQLIVPKHVGVSMPEGASFSYEPIVSSQVLGWVYTSGSTGEPLPHQKRWGFMLAGARALGDLLGWHEAMCPPAVLGTVPAQHSFGLETTVMLPLAWGGFIHPAQPLLPADIQHTLSELPEGNRWLMTTPLQLQACYNSGTRMPALQGIISATMPLARDLAVLIEQHWACPVWEIYGCTEAGMLALRRPAQTDVWRLIFPAMHLKTEGQTTWLETPELAEPLALADDIECLGTQHFRLLGRKSYLVKMAGKRIMLDELNHVLHQIKGVLDGVFFLPSLTSGRLVAFVVAPTLTKEAVLQALKKRIDPVFLPRPLWLLDALPRSGASKLTQADLLLLYQSCLHA